MSVPFVLLVILFVLMAVVGRERGVKAFLTLILNFAALYVMLFLMGYGFDPLRVTIIGSIVISSLILFYTNGVHRKTVASLLSVVIVVLITLLITYKMGVNAKIQGFSTEQAESISYLSLYVHLNFSELVICEILIGQLGAIVDVSISISSSVSEIFRNNRAATKLGLFQSGVKIGKDILGTMTNTLLFAYIGSFMALLIWFDMYKYSFGDIINAKIFCSEIFQILASGVGIVLIIPVTAAITPAVLSLQKARENAGA